MTDRMALEHIKFIENDRINQQLLKREIDRRITKIGMINSLKLKNSNILCQSNKSISALEAIPKVQSLTQTLDMDLTSMNQQKISSLFTHQQILKKDLNSERPTIEENPDCENFSASQDDQKKYIEKSRDSKFFSESNLELQKLIKTCKIDYSINASEEYAQNGDFLNNISMKESYQEPTSQIAVEGLPPNQIVTPMKTLMKQSNMRSSILKSSTRLFTSGNKSKMITSFIEDDVPLKRQPLSSINQNLKRSTCGVCASRKTKTERRYNERIYISQDCKRKTSDVILQFSLKPRKETNDNKVRQNLIKRVTEKSFVNLQERNN